MKKYHVYGIGNALVDMEFTVDPDWLIKMNVEKGVMTLVDEDRQHQLLGELDPFKAKRFCGGSAANTIIAMAQYGGRSFYSCKVAGDEVGDFYFENLLNEGVSTNLGSLRADGITGKCMVLITPDADRTMNTYLGISEGLSVDEVVEKEIQDSEYLYLEGYLCSSPTGKEAAIKAREIAEKAGVKTSLTLSDVAMVRFFREGLTNMLGNKVDMLFCNEDEAKAWVESDNFEDVLKKLKDVAHCYSITRGPRGAVVYNGYKDEWITVKAPEVHALDTTGAGDLYAGSFLYAVTHGKDFEQAGNLACMASSRLVTQYGARLLKDQIQELKLQEL